MEASKKRTKKAKKEKVKLTPEQRAEKRQAALARRAERAEQFAKDAKQEADIMEQGGVPALSTYRRLCKARHEVIRLEKRLAELGVEL